jgi:hypothetical protein
VIMLLGIPICVVRRPEINQILMETCMTRASTELQTLRFLSHSNAGNRIRNICWSIQKIWYKHCFISNQTAAKVTALWKLTVNSGITTAIKLTRSNLRIAASNKMQLQDCHTISNKLLPEFCHCCRLVAGSLAFLYACKQILN